MEPVAQRQDVVEPAVHELLARLLQFDNAMEQGAVEHGDRCGERGIQPYRDANVGAVFSG
jgi:hypothetical protein